MGSVQNSRSYPSADCGSDHQLVMAGIKLKLKAKKTTAKIRKINIEKLKDDQVKRDFHQKIEEKWQDHIKEPTANVEEEWNLIKYIIHATS